MRRYFRLLNHILGVFFRDTCNRLDKLMIYQRRKIAVDHMWILFFFQTVQLCWWMKYLGSYRWPAVEALPPREGVTSGRRMFSSPRIRSGGDVMYDFFFLFWYYPLFLDGRLKYISLPTNEFVGSQQYRVIVFGDSESLAGSKWLNRCRLFVQL